MDAPTTTPEHDPQQLTASQMFDSLTGFDELAVLRAFKANVAQLAHKETGNPFTFGRALVFVHQRRCGLKDSEAFSYAMGLPMRAALEYFAPDAADELDADDAAAAADLEDDDQGKAPQQ